MGGALFGGGGGGSAPPPQPQPQPKKTKPSPPPAPKKEKTVQPITPQVKDISPESSGSDVEDTSAPSRRRRARASSRGRGNLFSGGSSNLLGG